MRGYFSVPISMCMREINIFFITIIFTGLIVACNGGGISDPGTSDTSPPADLSYETASAIYTEGIAITENIPTVTGTAISWSVNPALPSGLVINDTTGIISGTPDTVQAASEYIVTAANDYGSTKTTISITVNPVPLSDLSYATASAVYTKGVAINGNVPSMTGTATSWSVNPALPGGLVINDTSGIISGTPDTIQTASEYIVTASNDYGSTTARILITVNPVPLSDLYYPTASAVYTKGVVIDDNIPSVTGTASSWSVNPALPSGIVIDDTTGVIYGTPDIVQATSEYIVTASNNFGSTTTTISITVNPVSLSDLSYATASAVYTKGVVIDDNIPSVTGTATSWSVNPALPGGLVIDNTTGVISGTPDTVQAADQYTITASNSSGSITVIISIEIKNKVARWGEAEWGIDLWNF